MDATALADLEVRVAAGDREAFADLYDVVAPRVYDDLLPVVGTVRAESLVMALLVDAWQHAPRLRRQRGSISAWVLTETRRLVAATSVPEPRAATTGAVLDAPPLALPGAVAAA